MSTKKTVLSFDDRTQKDVEELKREGHFPSIAETVRQSLRLNRTLIQLAKSGFGEIVIRNPETGEEKIVVVPWLDMEARQASN